MAHSVLHGPLGPITVFERDGAIVAVRWGVVAHGTSSPLLDTAIDQMKAYFDGQLSRFTLPLAAAATPFQQRVRDAMLRIAYGQLSTYAALAREIDSAPRAIGQACAHNPLPIIVPCHRVLAAAGRIGGYSGGDGLATKRALLGLEGVTFAGKNVFVATDDESSAA
jgi:methylated-DNA-[protein]-cysteine S-methyltransferase